jgi:2-methylcitrate dehydratase PrpD
MDTVKRSSVAADGGAKPSADDGIDVTRGLAEYAASLTFSALPAEVVELTKQCVLDAFGVMLGASGLAPEASIIADYVRDMGGRAESTIVGFGQQAPAPWAAFVNGSLGHMLDYDDVSAGGHVGIATIPVAFALAEQRKGISGRDVIAAIAAGMDVHTRVHLAIRIPDWTMAEGWFATQLIGFLSGAVTAGRLIRLNAERMENALGIAFTQCGGSRQMAVGESTHLRSMQAGFSSQGAILAACLAERGIVGSRQVLEGRYGFYRTYVRGEPDWAQLREDLGRRFGVLTHHGFKVWPGCAYTRPTNAAIGKLRDLHGVRAEDVASLTVIGGSATTALLFEPIEAKRRPQRVVDAQYSIPFTAAVMLKNGNVTLRDYLDGGLTNPEVLALAERISYRAPSAGTVSAGTGSDFSRPVVEAKLHDGRVIQEVAKEGVPGDARNRVGWNVLEAKFRDCASFARNPMSASRIDRAIEFIRTLEAQEDTADMMPILNEPH